MTERGEGETVTSVFTLVIDCGRKPGDGLPDGATGARLLVYVAATEEAEAVREAVAVLKDAGLAPLDVESFGTLKEREADGTLESEERALMAQAAEERAVIVAEVTPVREG